MILRRYGNTLESVDVEFDARAINEIGFRRNRRTSVPREEFEEQWTLRSSHDLACTAGGGVHDEVERALLDDLRQQLAALEEELGEDEALVVECEPGKDWPKTRQEQKRTPDGSMQFHLRVDPPLRIGVYGKGS